jgi:hypothetical protein
VGGDDVVMMLVMSFPKNEIETQVSYILKMCYTICMYIYISLYIEHVIDFRNAQFEIPDAGGYLNLCISGGLCNMYNLVIV